MFLVFGSTMYLLLLNLGLIFRLFNRVYSYWNENIYKKIPWYATVRWKKS